MTTQAPEFAHEQVVVRRGPRSGLPVTVAVHSTVRGPAVGGCRLWQYPRWQDAMGDALRLSEAMSLKCAAANLPAGGGKAVIALAPGQRLDAVERRAVLLDLGDLIEDLGGIYSTGEDVGTSAEDMQIVRERTVHAFGLPTRMGGIGEPSGATADGVHASILVTLERIFGRPDVAGRRFTVIGLGQVGSRLAARLVSEGAFVTATDTDPGKAGLARDIGASWVSPDGAHRPAAEVLVPAGVGGYLTAAVVGELNCRAVVGPANNQLAEPELADVLAGRGILWAPDFVANAGGVIFGLRATAGAAEEEVAAEVAGIGETLREVYDRCEVTGATPLAAAHALVADRLAPPARTPEPVDA